MRASPITGLCLVLALGPTAAEPTSPEPSDWYQIEFIVFAPISPRAGDEAWPTRSLSYPDTMIHVDDNGARPTLLAQLDDLQRFEAMFSEDGAAADEPAAREFLFEDRSRNRAARQMEARMAAMARREREARREAAENDGDDKDEVLAPVNVIDDEALTTLFASDAPRPFEAVDGGDRFLARVAGSIRRSSGYRLLTHSAWRQPIDEGDTWPVLVQAGEQYGDKYEVDGTLTFRRSRYLHVDTDLWFTRFTEEDDGLPAGPRQVGPRSVGPRSVGPRSVGPTDPNDDIDPRQARDYPELLAAARQGEQYLPVHTHQLATSRRVRRSELHYLDHPFFGVIVRIERFDYAEEAEE